MIQARCPICEKAMAGQSTEFPHLPFCSERCRRIDLGRWLGERYRVPDPTGELDADDPDLLPPTDP
jgi:uncharacterized protein